MSEDLFAADAVADPPNAPLRFSLLALATGIAGALTIPGYEHGLNLLLTFVAMGVAVVAGRPRSISPASLLFGAASLAFVTTAVLRDAQWVVGVNLMFAGMLAILTVAGLMSWTQMLRHGIFAGFRMLDGIGFAFRPLWQRLGGLGWRRVGATARGAAIGAMLLVIFGALFFTADHAFAQLTRDAMIVDWDLSLLPARVVVGIFLIAGTGALVLTGSRLGSPAPVLLRTVGFVSGPSPRSDRLPRTLDRAEWVIPLVLLNLLFVAFVAVQVTVLFGGQRHVLDTAGLTYAEYARNGFFQLCAVGAGALAVVAGTAFVAQRKTRLDDFLLRLLLGLLMALTLVILVSALKRLGLYEATYGYTRLRLSVHATILWLAGIIGLVLLAGIRLDARWMPAATIAFTAAGLLTFTALNPDAMIARHNVDRFERTGKIDLHYVSGLSADAAAELQALPQPLQECALAGLTGRLGAEPWVSFNLARHRARPIVDAGPRPNCPQVVSTGESLP